ncbi:hypothetical protein DFH07DRAFT_824202 [Mycena maculata]|uniref:EthD domain-containing protein n=1 Tax=Mycena maculata TaxID=230809 RepID=A0AAD7NB27_9AGAR|nr:hypothetical protein DFH07DRAFT_824202 [Mycena maculata]
MPVRFLCFLTRLPTISFQTFDQLWSEHAKLVHTHLTAVRNGTVKYTQFHVDPKLCDELNSITGRSVMEYDGIAEWEAETLQEIMDCLRSRECLEHLRPDDAKFLYAERTQSMIGRDQISPLAR